MHSVIQLRHRRSDTFIMQELGKQHFRNHSIGIGKGLRLKAHTLAHGQKQIAEVGLVIDGFVVVTDPVLVAFKGIDPSVEVNVAAMFESQALPSSQQQRQASGSVAVAIGKPTTIEGHGRVDERRLTVHTLRKPVQKIGQLGDVEGITAGQFLQKIPIPIVVR